MDFLDPEAKRKHKIRLIIGYGLVGTLILIATIILVFQAYGFGVNRKTGEVIQNGLVFVDSAPDNAKILVNGKEYKDKSNTRLTLPEGHYDLKIQKEGYRDWTKSFDLKGGYVERFSYPMLIPASLRPSQLGTFDQVPSFSTESPDRRWMLVSKGQSFIDYTMYDLNAVTQEKPAEQPLSFPASIFTPAQGAQTLELIEWSTDNKHLLVKHTFTGGTEFVVLSRDTPTTSININKLLNLNPTKVVLRDKKFDQWYIYSQDGGVLQTADTTKAVTSVLKNVGEFKTHGADRILYSTPSSSPNSTKIVLQDGKQTYQIRDILNGPVYLDIAQYDSAWYVVVGTEAEHKAYIYKDPQTELSRNGGKSIAPFQVLRSTTPLTQVSFSQNTRFILAQSGQHFETYDAEDKLTFQYDLDKTIEPNTKPIWMDGHRLLARSEGRVIMFDFDGGNQQNVGFATPTSQVGFDRDYTVMYTVSNSNTDEKKGGFFNTQLRTPQDQ